jgi:hypothetical protein
MDGELRYQPAKLIQRKWRQAEGVSIDVVLDQAVRQRAGVGSD